MITNRSLVAASLLFAVPLITSAKTFKEIVDTFFVPLGDSIIYLLYLLAFLAFIWGVLKYFFINSSEEGRQKGKQLMLWGIIGLVVLFGVWGLVKALISVLTSWSA